MTCWLKVARLMTRPNSSSTATAPGCLSGPFITICRSSLTGNTRCSQQAAMLLKQRVSMYHFAMERYNLDKGASGLPATRYVVSMQLSVEAERGRELVPQKYMEWSASWTTGHATCVALPEKLMIRAHSFPARCAIHTMMV